MDLKPRTTNEEGNVKIEHYPTSSQLKLIIKQNIQVDWDKHKDVIEEIWLEYKDFDNIKKLFNKINF